jgi:hypothetical protein
LEACHQHRQQTTVLIYYINLRISVLTTVTRDHNINRSASGTLLSSELELSFWGGVNSQSGEIVYRHHPLSGQHLKGTILAIPVVSAHVLEVESYWNSFSMAMDPEALSSRGPN